MLIGGPGVIEPRAVSRFDQAIATTESAGLAGVAE